jgi:hypothetical protein
MGEYQNPTYRGIKDPSAFTNAFNQSFSLWFDKVTAILINKKNQKTKQAIAYQQSKDDYAKKVHGFYTDNKKEIDSANSAHLGVVKSINFLNEQYTRYASNNQLTDGDFRRSGDEFKMAITPINLMSGTFWGDNSVNLTNLNMGHGNDFQLLKQLKIDVEGSTDEQIQGMFGLNLLMPGQPVPEGYRVGQIYGKDIVLSTGEKITPSELTRMLIQARHPGNKLHGENTSMSAINTGMDVLVDNANSNTKKNIDVQYRGDVGGNYDDYEKQRDDDFTTHVKNEVDDWSGKNNFSPTLWHNKMNVRDKLFSEGDIDPNGNAMSAEVAERLNRLEFGDIQKMLNNMESEGNTGVDSTWPGDDTPGLGIPEEGAELPTQIDYDLASYIIDAQNGKIVDYLVKENIDKLDAVTRPKPLTIKESKKPFYEIKTENQGILYDNYESDFSELMSVYTDPERYTVDNVTVSGKSLQDFLMHKAIKVGDNNTTIMAVKLGENKEKAFNEDGSPNKAYKSGGVLTLSVEWAKKSGGVVTLDKEYDLTLMNHNDFYELIGGLTGTLKPEEVINENKRYGRINQNPY